MKPKKRLLGLSVDDYIHPAERDPVVDLEKIKPLAMAMDRLSELSMTLCQRIILGKYAEVTRQMLPRAYEVLEDVCSILGFPVVPRLFITHDYQPRCLQIGLSTMYILMPDLILSSGDEDMLYFLFGNAVAIFKGGHLRLSTVNAVLNYIPEALPFRLVLQGKQRAADLSSDRAGLLACQNFSAAVRCILWEMGLPPRELMAMSDDDVLALAAEYPKAVENLYQDALSQAATTWKKWNGTVSPGYVRIQELYTWYQNAYPGLMDRLVVESN